MSSTHLEIHLLKNIILECNKVNIFKKDYSILIKKGINLGTVNGLAEKISINLCTSQGAIKIIKRMISSGIIEKRDGFVFVLPQRITEYYESKEPCARIILSGKYDIIKK